MIEDFESKVSILTPTYNSERTIAQTIESVQSQTYSNWEMILVDDCSHDSTRDIVREQMAKDARIRGVFLQENKGAAAARNEALGYATGRYVAYLDSDDVWYPEKLEKQIDFMTKGRFGFSCTSYEVVDKNGLPLGKVVKMLPEVDYWGFLENNLLQTVGVMVDTAIVPRQLLVMPDLRRRQDAATWLQILKRDFKCYGMQECLAQYRRTPKSLSSNKLHAIKGVWFVYRDVEKLSLQKSIQCFVRYAFYAVYKRMYKPSMVVRSKRNQKEV